MISGQIEIEKEGKLTSGGTPEEKAIISVPNAELNRAIKNAQDQLEKKFAADLEKETSNINKKLEELNRDKISFITVSGIFVAIFTFISVEIQILKYICDFNMIVGYTFIFPGVLIFFIALLDYVARGWIKTAEEVQSRVFPVLMVAIALIILGLAVIHNSKGGWVC